MTKQQVSSTDMVPIANPETGEIVEVARWVTALPMASSGADASEQIVARILAAESPDELLTPAKGQALADHVGEPLVIHDVRLMPSALNAGVGAYAVCDVESTKTGERFIATTGARNVLAQLVKAYTSGWLPLACKVTETVSKNDPARKIQWLVMPEAF